MVSHPGIRLLRVLPVIVILIGGALPAASAVPSSGTPLPSLSPARGQLSITSDPAGAEIYLRASPVPSGTTKAVLTLDAGEYQVILKREGYTDYLTTIIVTAGSVTTIDAALSPLPPTGSIWVTSRPAKAMIYVDGEYRGLTPLALSEAVGTHTFLLTRTGYRDHSEEVNVSSESTTFVSAVLDPLATGTGFIAVSSNPPGAQVSFDGIPSGTTPVTIDSSPGPHTLSLAMDGYKDYTTIVSLDAGATTPLDVVLEPAGQVTTAPTPRQETGSITAASFPNGAYVFIDDEMRGVTPVTVAGLAPRNYTVRISMQGFADNTREVPVAAGQDTVVYTDLIPSEKVVPGFGCLVTLLSIILFVTLGRRSRG
ncbi:MAG: PEGA domain-containing protein [Methanomicrobiales archaeon]|nr:PEGA domain-containing protein [Methanomicrobiales archaeon]